MDIVTARQALADLAATIDVPGAGKLRSTVELAGVVNPPEFRTGLCTIDNYTVGRILTLEFDCAVIVGIASTRSAQLLLESDLVPVLMDAIDNAGTIAGFDLSPYDGVAAFNLGKVSGPKRTGSEGSEMWGYDIPVQVLAGS